MSVLETESIKDKTPSINTASSEKLEEGPAQDEVQDVNEVFWEGPLDPANPLNWSTKKKGVNITILSAMTFLTPVASSMFAPGIPEVMKEFKSDSSLLAAFVISVYILGWAIGPVVIAPLSELYGRMIVYHVCNVGFICFTVACALAPSLNALLILRFIQGCWSISPLTIGAGTIADMVKTENRGTAMSLWSIGPLLGPTVGPIIGGFLSHAMGWRWIFWVLAMATSATALAALLFMRESYGPVLLSRKAKRMRLETGNANIRSKLDNGLSPKDLFKRAIVRPTKLLFLSPICLLLSLYIAIVYGTLYILFTTFTFVFEDTYGFSEATVGLTFTGTGIGMLLCVGVLGVVSDRTLKRLAAKNFGVLKPEFRLPPLMYFAPTLPIGLFIYGWSAQYKVQWAVPLFGTAIFGAGQVANFMCITSYLVDTYTRYAASAVAASTVLRAILGAVLPLIGLPMYDALGLGWGNSLLAFVTLALCPLPFIFYAYGERIRTYPRFQVEL